MNLIRTTAIALLTCLPLLACSDNSPATADPAAEPKTMIGKAVKQATNEARQELAKGNITLSRDGSSPAEITPQGDLLIDGKAVPVDDAQRKLVLEYRGQIVAIAEAGIGIGVQGADLAGKAVGEALKGVFSGNTDQIEQKIEAEAKGIEQAAVKLCERLPALLDAQNRLVAALPAFQPYAKMDQTDIDDCGKDGNFNVDIPGTTINTDFAVDEGGNAAAEAEAASAEPAK
jgi:Protein of unknown function (DUF2884)